MEDLIEQKASDFEISKEIKKSIKEYLDSLDDIFKQKQGKDFLVKHTKKIDEFIDTVYRYVLRKFFGDYLPFQSQIPIVLSALGSYGREQLCVYSDIDIMFVYEDIKGYNAEEIIRSVLHILWDAGLKLGHRTHKLDELLEASKQDITVKTAMLETRFLCGSKILWMKTQREIDRIRAYKQKEFILTLQKINAVRYKKFQFDMEPNIKEGIGGLRDANSLFWVANALYRVRNIKELIPKYINEGEYKEYRTALEFLFRVRSALHLSSKKKNDTLNLQNIPDVAKMLGFKDGRYKSAQNQLVSQTLHSLKTIKTTTKLLIKKLTKSVLFDKKNIPLLKNSRISPEIYLCNDTLIASLDKQGDGYIDILKMSLRLSDKDLNFDISYINYLKKTKFNKKNSKKIYKYKKELFYKNRIYKLFDAYFQADILQEVFTPFKKIMNLPQFDGYHKYPVDIHSIKSLYFLENIDDKDIKKLFDELSEDEKALLRLVIFFHDIGKGRKKDHRVVGASIFKTQAEKLGFDEKSINLGSLLIKYHTLMNTTASREDIYSEQVILSFISRLRSVKALNMLYILTYCDMKAVNNKIYSPFFSSLLKELYGISLDTFEKEELIDETSRRLRKENSLKRFDDFKKLKKPLQKKILSIGSNIFFIKHKPSQIVSLSLWANSLKDKEYDYKIDNSQNLSISIMRKNELNVGYLLGKLSFLNVSGMDIFKLFDEIKYFKIDFLEKIEQDEILFIKEVLQKSFDMSRKIGYNIPKIDRKDLLFDCNHSKTYAKMILHTKDQKALMAHVVSVFDEFGVDIATAKIQTIKQKAHNLFLIEKNGKFCDNIEKIKEKICAG
ncbi:MAG: HD domain-containing protein [Epsilonproteobacteria bacterium]|nr:HD domain-containing protein [Campylobacterota bacterium]